MNDSMKNDYLDEGERDLDEALRSVDVHALPTPDAETQAMFQEAAAHAMQQEARVNLHINTLELTKIKQQAANEGLKYQSFMQNVLHKYMTGQLVEVPVG